MTSGFIIIPPKLPEKEKPQTNTGLSGFVKRGPKEPVITKEAALSAFLSVKQAIEEDPSILNVQKVTAGKVLKESPGAANVRFLRDRQAELVRTGKSAETDGRKKRSVRVVVGMLFGDLTVVRKMPPRKNVKSWLRDRYRCRCVCGNEEVVPKYYLLRMPNPKTHCGCKTNIPTLKSTHKREFLIWHMMHQRCENPNHASYNHYKSRGIVIDPLFSKHREDGKGFENWFNHVGAAPTIYHSLDRVHNGRGYIPGNLKWSTSEEQRKNQGDRIGGYTIDEIDEMGYTEDEFIEKVIAGEIE